jgi:putative FmdB family regulatory protein
MPIYEYECTGCGQRIEIYEKSAFPSAQQPGQCKCCHKLVTFQKVEISTTARPIFKGTGWYETTYKKKPVK